MLRILLFKRIYDIIEYIDGILYLVLFRFILEIIFVFFCIRERNLFLCLDMFYGWNLFVELKYDLYLKLFLLNCVYGKYK